MSVKDLSSMSGRSRFLIVAVILLLVMVGAAAAIATGDDQPIPRAPAEVDDDVAGGVTEVDDDGAGDAVEDEVEGPDQPIMGPDLERASQVALDYLGGGQVTGTEVEDEESFYEIEVTRDDGSQVDVQLDESFEVIGTD